MAHLRAALEGCAAAAVGDLRVSTVYETDPVDCAPGAPLFLNAAAVFATCLEAHALLRALRVVERARGRPTVSPRNAPRPLDIDLLLLGDLRVNDAELILPHPRMFQRVFVLRPLCELAPAWVPPGGDRTLKDFLDSLPASDDVRPWKEALR